MTTPTQARVLRGSDIAAMWIFVGAGIAVVGVTLFFAIGRIVDALSGKALPVEALFSDTTVAAPIGPDGAMRDILLERAWITPSSLSIAGTGALVLQQLVLAASVTALVVCLLLVTLSVMRGRVFNRRNTALVVSAGASGLAGLFGVPFFGNIVANDAFRDISQGTFDNPIISVELPPVILAAFIVAMASTVFTVGDRLQRDTEGLV